MTKPRWSKDDPAVQRALRQLEAELSHPKMAEALTGETPPKKRGVTVTEAAEIAAEALEIVYRLGYDLLSDRERDAIGIVRYACAEIADGDRP
jgi:hypothetical protein